MKIYMEVDMEGISGVMTEDQIFPERKSKDFTDACLLMTGDINAAVEGAVAAGATEIVVNDGHHTGFNVLLERLHPKARCLQGVSRPRHEPAGLDESFDAAFLVGFHAMAGTQGAVLDHSYWFTGVQNIFLNGRRIGELGVESALAGRLGVPVVLVTGDRALTREAADFLGQEVEVVAVKEGLSRFTATCLSLDESRRLITEEASRAVRKAHQIRPFVVQPPLTFRVEYSTSNICDGKERLGGLPGIKRLDARTMEYEVDDLRTFKALL